MRFSKGVLAAAMLALMASPTSAQNSVESWLNGFAMEVGKTRANYTSVVQGLGCCEESKQKAEKDWEEINAALAEALTQSRKEKLGFGFCSSMDFVGLHIGFTSIRMRMLARSGKDRENAGSTSEQTIRQLENIASDMKSLEASARAYKERLGCRTRG